MGVLQIIITVLALVFAVGAVLLMLEGEILIGFIIGAVAAVTIFLSSSGAFSSFTLSVPESLTESLVAQTTGVAGRGGIPERPVPAAPGKPDRDVPAAPGKPDRDVPAVPAVPAAPAAPDASAAPGAELDYKDPTYLKQMAEFKKEEAEFQKQQNRYNQEKAEFQKQSEEYKQYLEELDEFEKKSAQNGAELKSLQEQYKKDKAAYDSAKKKQAAYEDQMDKYNQEKDQVDLFNQKEKERYEEDQRSFEQANKERGKALKEQARLLREAEAMDDTIEAKVEVSRKGKNWVFTNSVTGEIIDTQPVSKVRVFDKAATKKAIEKRKKEIEIQFKDGDDKAKLQKKFNAKLEKYNKTKANIRNEKGRTQAKQMQRELESLEKQIRGEETGGPSGFPILRSESDEVTKNYIALYSDWADNMDPGTLYRIYEKLPPELRKGGKDYKTKVKKSINGMRDGLTDPQQYFDSNYRALDTDYRNALRGISTVLNGNDGKYHDQISYLAKTPGKYPDLEKLLKDYTKEQDGEKAYDLQNQIIAKADKRLNRDPKELGEDLPEFEEQEIEETSAEKERLLKEANDIKVFDTRDEDPPEGGTVSTPNPEKKKARKAAKQFKIPKEPEKVKPLKLKTPKLKQPKPPGKLPKEPKAPKLKSTAKPPKEVKKPKPPGKAPKPLGKAPKPPAKAPKPLKAPKPSAKAPKPLKASKTLKAFKVNLKGDALKPPQVRQQVSPEVMKEIQAGIMIDKAYEDVLQENPDLSDQQKQEALQQIREQVLKALG